MISKADFFIHPQYISIEVYITHIFAEIHSLPYSFFMYRYRRLNSVLVWQSLPRLQIVQKKLETKLAHPQSNSSFVKEFIHGGKLKRRPQPFQIVSMAIVKQPQYLLRYGIHTP